MKKNKKLILASTFLCVLLSKPILACTRAVYFGKENQTITGRSMDWSEDMDSHFYLFPRGMKREGGGNNNPIQWTSKYGSVITSIYEGGTADGMNEKGLVANLLFLTESVYPEKVDDRPVLYISAWAQYILDNYSTVKEAVEDLQKEEFLVKVSKAPNGIYGNVHLAISDENGDSAILEYIDGKLVIHHGKEYQILTNSPIYSEQLAINKYWKEVGTANMLPGTNRAADRFVRASYYINESTQTADPNEALATVASVIRNVSVPRGFKRENAPNLSTTIWRTYADQKNKRYFFEDTANPSLVWVNFDKLDFSSTGGVKKVILTNKEGLTGDLTSKFKSAEKFEFLTE
ncbi:MAG: linear amide C-N hydrolase [Cetobacterium sp.]